MIRSALVATLITLLSLALSACATAPPPEVPAPVSAAPVRTVVAPGPASFVDFAPLFGRALVSNSVRVSGWSAAWLARVMLSPNVHVPGAREAGPEGPLVLDESPAGEAVLPALSGALLRILLGHGTEVFPPVNLHAWREDLPGSAGAVWSWSERALRLSREAGRPSALLIVEDLAVTRSPIDVVLLPDDTGFHAALRGRDDEGVCPPMRWSVPTLTFLAEIVTTEDGRLVARIDERRSSPLVSRGLAAIEGGAAARSLVRQRHTYADAPALQGFCAEVERHFQAFLEQTGRFDDAPDVLRGFLTPVLDPLYVSARSAAPSEGPADAPPAEPVRGTRRRRGR